MHKSDMASNDKPAQPVEDFELLERISDACVMISFTGRFEQRSVVSKAKIFTLNYQANNIRATFGKTRHNDKLKQSINIIEKSDALNIYIALNLPQIDVPAIKRTIIMIRKYKRLHLGRHEFGEAITVGYD